MTLSQQLVARLRSLEPSAIPEEVRDAARLHLLDAVGVGFAAAATGAGAPYLKAARALSGAGPATIFGSDAGHTAAAAALDTRIGATPGASGSPFPPLAALYQQLQPLTGVTAVTAGTSTFVESSRPPSPTSTTAASTPAR